MITHRKLADVEVSDGLYSTPRWGTQALLKYVELKDPILEPCCGRGEMAEVLKAAGHQVICSDIADYGYGRVADFFEIWPKVECVCTNPPFRLAEEMLDHAMQITGNRGKICFLLRTAFLESRRRYERFFKYRPPTRLLVFSERLTMFPDGMEPTNGGTTSYSWFVWDNTQPRLPYPHATAITWIEPGLKPANPNQMELFDALSG